MIQIKYKNTRCQSECYPSDLMYNSGQISECHGFLEAYELWLMTYESVWITSVIAKVQYTQQLIWWQYKLYIIKND